MTARSWTTLDLRRGLVILGAASLLSSCASFGNLTSASAPSAARPPVDEDTALAASPANIQSLTEVIGRNPNDAQAYNVRGTVLGRGGRNAEAIADFDKAIALDPNYAQAYANRGVVHRQMNRLDLALSDYNRALGIDANYAAAYVGRGIVYRQQGQSMQAFADFNKAISIRPDNPQAYYNSGILYHGQK